jgi:hypothetical protein
MRTTAIMMLAPVLTPMAQTVAQDSLQGSEDANATEVDSNDEGSEAQKIDGQQSDSDQHMPAQKSKRQRAVSPASEIFEESGDGPRRGIRFGELWDRPRRTSWAQ